MEDRMKYLYQTTYKSRIDNSDNMGKIIDDIDSSVDSLVSKINSRSASDISNLFLRLQEKNATADQIGKSLEEIFNNTGVLDSINLDYLAKSIQAQDHQYRMICKYMPELDDALEIKKDNVLSSDNFTKEFINVISDRGGKEFLDQFNDRAKTVKDKYDYQNLCEEIYDDCSHIGEYFLYCVPYNKALERLLDRKSRYGTSSGIQGGSYRYEQTIFEASSFLNDDNYKDLVPAYRDSIAEDASVKITFDHSTTLSKVIEYVEQREKVKNQVVGISEEFLHEASGDKKVIKNSAGFDTLIAPDGFIDTKNRKKTEVKEIAGAVIHKIPRDRIFPICIGDDTVLGYLYLEVENDYVNGIISHGGTYNSLLSRPSMISPELMDQQNDLLIGQIANQMSQAIDAEFINANVDIKEEIYAILRYNDAFCATQGVNNITVSFLPASDVIHFYFKKDKKTHRGISDLEKALVPAMLYCLLYLSDIIMKVSRSQDKRVYYVKQNIETNVAKTMHNVLNQIKRGNMGMRQLQSMNTIFNMIGKYNDYLIPIGPSGEAPVTFEVMSGQQVDTPTELMDRVKESAIATTDVPLEFVQSTNQVDYATRFSMSNSKFLRKIYKRQRICQDQYSQLFRNLYNYEYMTNEQGIKVLLPAPAYLTTSNTQQLIESVKNQAQGIADMCFTEEEDDAKQEFIREYTKKNLGTYIDFDAVDDMIAEVRQRIEYRKLVNSEPDDSSAEGDSGDYGDY